MLFWLSLYGPLCRSRHFDAQVNFYDGLGIASTTVTLNDAIKDKALILQDIGIGAMDALHLAYAEAGKAEYFLTCDDDVIKKIANNRDMLKLEVCNPLEFILKEVFRNAQNSSS